MVNTNHTVFHPAMFVLLGIPGLEKYHIWLSIPLSFLYATAVLGNSILILVIVMEHSLHEPMYMFLSMLAGTDILLSTTTAPKVLAIFWFNARDITFDACITQVFFVHVTFVEESAILLVMAFDCYIAICAPLRYSTILTTSVVWRLALAIFLRSFCVVFPIIFLLKRLPFCRTNVIPHSYCEHIGVARLACADITVNIWYGFSLPILTALIDMVLVAVSYTLILRAIFRMPSQDARHKALNTCGSHLCVIIMFYFPFFFTVLTHRFWSNFPRHVHILLANLYVVVPPMLNPIVYGMKMKQIREAVAHFFMEIKKWFSSSSLG